MQSPLRILAIGDSLTAGFHEYGLAHHPYSIKLSSLFSASNIPVVIDQHGVSGERVVSSMVKRLEKYLPNDQDSPYDWVIILGGTNDLAYRTSAEKLFNEGLKVMYDRVLQSSHGKCKLAAMTVIENGVYQRTKPQDQPRQHLNQLIRTYVENYEDQNRICLVDLDSKILYHSMTNISERRSIWDDQIHLTAKGYDQMAEYIFQEIQKKIQSN